MAESSRSVSTIPPNRFPAKTVSILLVIVVLCALSFYAGVNYQNGKASKTATGRGQFGQFGGFGGGFRRGSRTIGSVTAISSTSVTVKDQSGASKTFALNSSTQITKNGSSAGASDIQVGDTVIVRASTNSATAATIDDPSLGPQTSPSSTPAQST